VNSVIVYGIVNYDLMLAASYNIFPLIREGVHASSGMEIGVTDSLLIGKKNYNLLKIAVARQGLYEGRRSAVVVEDSAA
jgi:hypothetical protein